MEANYSSYRDLIELFMKLKNEEGVIPEIWAVGSEIELHPSFGNRNLRIYSASKRKYAKYAAELYHKKTVVYRHIVPAAFRSRMGRGLMSAKTAAAVTTFFVHQNCNYIPVTYTSIACQNYLKFVKL
jgi:monoglucosyldiacylglycerol epimerase